MIRVLGPSMSRASSCRTVAPREDIQKSVFVDASRRSGANGKHLSAFDRSGLHQRDRGGRWHLEDSRGNGYSYKDQNRTPEFGAPLLDQGAESTPDFKPHEGHPDADDRDDNGGDRDGHFMGPECKTNDEIVDAEGGTGDNKADWSRRARQFVGCRRLACTTVTIPVTIRSPAPRYDADEPMDVATLRPIKSPSSGIAASKKPKTMATRARRLASTPERPMPMAAAKFDKPSAKATNAIADTQRN